MRDRFFLLYKVLTLKNSILEFSRRFVVLGDVHAVSLIRELEDLFYDLRILTEKGFVNDPTVNLPVLLDMVKYYRLKRLVDQLESIDNKKKPIKKSEADSVFSGSVVLNTICFNFVLLTMYRIVIMIEE